MLRDGLSTAAIFHDCENRYIIKKLNEEIALFTEYRTRLISDVVTGKIDVRGVVVPEYEADSEETLEDDAETELMESGE